MVAKHTPKRLEFHGLMQRTMDADPERVRKLHELAEGSAFHVAEYDEPTAAHRRAGASPGAYALQGLHVRVIALRRSRGLACAWMLR